MSGSYDLPHDFPQAQHLHDGALVVAIDGPSGSGKSSVSREIARRNGLAYQDTGAMYRALTWLCQQEGVDLHDPCALAALARSFFYDQDTDPLSVRVLTGKSRWEAEEVTEQIRSSQVAGEVSTVAADIHVRQELISRQREAIVASEYRMVVEGRDITTVVAPLAQVRILLTASPQVRVLRRQQQAAGSGHSLSGTQLEAQVIERDSRDAAVTQFEQAAEGVVRVDSSCLDFEATVAAIQSVIDSLPQGADR